MKNLHFLLRFLSIRPLLLIALMGLANDENVNNCNEPIALFRNVASLYNVQDSSAGMIPHLDLNDFELIDTTLLNLICFWKILGYECLEIFIMVKFYRKSVTTGATPSVTLLGTSIRDTNNVAFMKQTQMMSRMHVLFRHHPKWQVFWYYI